MRPLKLLLSLILIASNLHSFSQSSAASTVKVAVLLPLYLDSAFNGSTYKLGNNNLPKYILPGLEFYNGVMMAVDSLQKEGQHLEVMIHDTKAKDKSLSLLLVEPEISTASFIIGSFTTKDELKKVADFAAAHNIPLISATYPNDGGITGNTHLALLNPTLPVHVDAVYKYVQRNYSLDNIILLKRKSDATDKYVADLLMDAAKKYSALPVRWKYIEVSDVFNPQEIISHLDSTKHNIVIGATLNETFATNIVRTLNSVKTTYQGTAVGMPTWDNMPLLNKADTRGIEVVYSTVYSYQRSDKFLGRLAAAYKNKSNGRASDMVFKGYEAMYHFSKLYLKHGSAFMGNLSDKDFKITNEFDFQPSKARKENATADYYENKKLYFVKKQDGTIKSIN